MMSMQNFSFLARLEVAEKFVVVGWGGVVVVVGWWSRPSLGFSFSQAEQFSVQIVLNWNWPTGTELGKIVATNVVTDKR